MKYNALESVRVMFFLSETRQERLLCAYRKKFPCDNTYPIKVLIGERLCLERIIKRLFTDTDKCVIKLTDNDNMENTKCIPAAAKLSSPTPRRLEF